MLMLTTDQISSKKLFLIQSYKLTKWMCVEDSFSQIQSYIKVS